MDRRVLDQLEGLHRSARDGPSTALQAQHARPGPIYRNATPGTRDELMNSPSGRYGTESYEHGYNYDSRGRLLAPSLRPNDYGPPMTRSIVDDAISRAQLSQFANHNPYDHFGPPPAPQKSAFDLSRFALGSDQSGPSSSPPIVRALPSSPALSASQRRLHVAPSDAGYYGRGSGPAPSPQGQVYQPVGVEQLEREERQWHAFEEPSGVSQAMVVSRLPQPPPQPAFQPVNRPPASNMSAPIVNGIQLVPISELPDRFQFVFPFRLFNAVQSKCFNTVYKTSDNFVLSAPTASGKTALLELAICRLVNTNPTGTFKIVYQAPTKALCSERHRDWQAKFAHLDLQCAELTGDTNNARLPNVQHASIIVTTPEKWDSMTRKWKDQQRLMEMVKLFLIDEVHILKDERGATLEAVVSRMKSVGSGVRFVALSATVPNSQDIASWLGKSPAEQHLPAAMERFGEEFRPVRLRKHVCGYQASTNDFAFDKTLNTKLLDVVTMYSERKPIMVFCFTRSSCVETARALANFWASKSPQDRRWSAPRAQIRVADNELRETVTSGVAFHHAGLQSDDRLAIEKGYLDGDVGVICCTSTLAVGVNLPCHMVVIKNTVSYQAGGLRGCKEYSDLEIMQMLGRAGRPQFDQSAVAVIMTRQTRVHHYEKMTSGQETLESCLHRNLIDHLNAEIGLGTITDTASATRWLMGTFLYVRLQANPEHYKLDTKSAGHDLGERLQTISTQAIELLKTHELVVSSPTLHCTEFGDAMTRYYVQFETMKTILALPPGSKVSEILSTIAQATEFRDVRFRSGEKSAYKDLNKDPSIKFTIPVNLESPAHKVSLVMQAVLGGVELSSEDRKHRIDFQATKIAVFQHSQRLVRCIIDCKLHLKDGIAARNALMLSRSLGGQVWDDSPLHMKQLDGVGLVTVRKLVMAGIKSVEDLEAADASRIEMLMTRRPPCGIQFVDKAKAFPRLRVSVVTIGKPVASRDHPVTLRLRAVFGFLNERVPEMFQRKPVYVCLLVTTCDGQLLHFVRISAKTLGMGQEMVFDARLLRPAQSLEAYAMCDEIAGTARHAFVKLDIPARMFPSNATPMATSTKSQATIAEVDLSGCNVVGKRPCSATSGDDFFDAGLDDESLAQLETDDFMDIDEVQARSNDRPGPPAKRQRTASLDVADNESWQPNRRANGNWECNHHCKNKTKCKHLCCRDGLESKPKPPKSKAVDAKKANDAIVSSAARSSETPRGASGPKQQKLTISTARTQAPPTPASSSRSKSVKDKSPQDVRSIALDSLQRLHSSAGLSQHAPCSKPARRLEENDAADDRRAMTVTDLALQMEDDTEYLADYEARNAPSEQLPHVAELVRKRRDDVSVVNDTDMEDVGGQRPLPIAQRLPPRECTYSGCSTTATSKDTAGLQDLAAGNAHSNAYSVQEFDDYIDFGDPIVYHNSEDESTSRSNDEASLHSAGLLPNPLKYIDDPLISDVRPCSAGETFPAVPATEADGDAYAASDTDLIDERDGVDSAARDGAIDRVVRNETVSIADAEEQKRLDELEAWFKAEFGSEDYNFVR